MNSLLRSVNPMTNKRNILVRESLQKQLITSIIEMEGAPGAADGGIVANCDETMTLCSVLEGIFLHGLKDSLLNRVTEVFSGPDVDAMPQPSFWGPLLVFSHRQIIDQIQALTQVTTEVGYCRAWIRLALNEGLLASYFSAIRRDNSALKPYYNRYAFMRDTDLIEVAQRLIENLEYIRLELACNSSLLNFWTSTPLLIAGIWSPPMKSCPVFSAVDIAKTVSAETTAVVEAFDEIETASSIGSLGSFNSSHSPLNNVAHITEDEALKIILRNEEDVDEAGESANEGRYEKPRSEEGYEKVEESDVNASSDSGMEPTKEIGASTATGNSLIGKLGWSTSFEDCESHPATSDDAARTPAEGPTYDALIQSYHTTGNARMPNLEEYLEKYSKKECAPEEAKEQPPDDKMPMNLDDQLGKLPREKGLDVQNYSCFECGHSIGMAFSKAYVCSYTGDYFCAKCMAPDDYLIPSRMIHNWDLRRYPVSQNVAKYLTDGTALLDLKNFNPKIYMAVDAMAQLQSLRIQLNLLRAYLFTCREPIIESLQKKVAPRDYLYEHVHRYSVSDLLDITTGVLAQQLQKVVEFSRNHVVNCWLCSQKGFICEVCNDPRVIYPFDMDSTYRCASCNAVFHAGCLTTSQPCPKCERRRKRMDLPLLNIECNDLPNNPQASPPIPT